MRLFTPYPLVLPAKAELPFGLTGILARDSRFRGNDRGAGFTLAELLIALAILGVIATFTIPKILQSQQDGRNKAMAKEAAGTVSQAFLLYKLKNAITSNTNLSDLTPYLNYVSIQTTGLVDHIPSNGTMDCSDSGMVCLKLHNGAVLWWIPSDWSRLGGTGPLNGMFFLIDPDGTASATKATQFFIYSTGKLRSNETLEPGSACAANGSMTPGAPGTDPPYFSWN